MVGSHQTGFRATWNEQKGVDFVLLYRMSCFSNVLVMRHNLCGLEGIELVHQLAGCGRMVLIYNAHRHIGRHTILHQGGEENHHGDGEDDHAEEIDRVLPHDAAFSEGNMI